MDFIVIDPQVPVECACALYLEPQGTKVYNDEKTDGKQILIMHPFEEYEKLEGATVSHICHNQVEIDWHVKHLRGGWMTYTTNPLEFLQTHFPFDHPKIKSLQMTEETVAAVKQLPGQTFFEQLRTYVSSN